MKRFPNTLLGKILMGSVVVLLYFLGAKLGLSLAFKNGSVSPVWPPTGVALAVLLLLGPSFWPAVLIGAFLSNLFLTPVGPFVSGGISVGNTLEAVMGAYLLRKAFPGKDYFLRFKNVLQFLFFG